MPCWLALVLLPGCWASGSFVQTTHYIGVFDPHEQVPQELYRVTITGESDLLSSVKYGSGWVAASAADLLAMDTDGGVNAAATKDSLPAQSAPPPHLEARRRFFEIGPLGVSTEPQDGRFVVIMSSDPNQFFRRLELMTRFGKTDSSETQRSRDAILSTIVADRRSALDQMKQLLEEEGNESR